MKVAQKPGSRPPAHRKAQPEPLAEGMRGEPYSPCEEELIRRRRAELMEEGHSDTPISKALSGELRRTAASIFSKILKMRRSGELPENPNGRNQADYTPAEYSHIRRRRAELMEEGLTDLSISESLSAELPHPVRSIYAKINAMRRSGSLQENPNKPSGYGSKEVLHIRRRRAELIEEGFTDRAISEVLSNELTRSSGSVDGKLRIMRKSGEIPPNPNKMQRFLPQELETLSDLRSELIRKRFNDLEISKTVSGVLLRSQDIVYAKLRELVKSGKIPKNPNRQKPYAAAELAAIARKREALIGQGLSDEAISKSLSPELRRTAGSIVRKIRKMVKSGELPENPNKRGRKVSEGEVLAQLKEAVSLYTEVSG